MDWKLLKWKHFGDDRGSLIALETGADIPFDIKRVTYLCGSDALNSFKFPYANLNSSFVLFMLRGECSLQIDDGYIRQDVILQEPTSGVYIGKMLWHNIVDMSRDGVMALVADKTYNANDYIYDYNQYVNLIRNIQVA